jgi:hypothetical protein
MSRKSIYVSGALAALAAGLWAPLSAWAHEEVESGGYIFEIGWLAEPPVVGERNGLELFVAPHDDPEAGVEGITTLQFTVEYGSASRTYELAPAQEEPGHYSASFIPAVEGQYTFRLTGTVEGQAVNVEFQPEEVVGAGELAFPPVEDLNSKVSIALGQAATAHTIAIIGALLGAGGIALAAYGLRRKG